MLGNLSGQAGKDFAQSEACFLEPEPVKLGHLVRLAFCKEECQGVPFPKVPADDQEMQEM